MKNWCLSVNTLSLHYQISLSNKTSLYPGLCFHVRYNITIMHRYVCVQSQTGHALAQDHRKSRLARLHKQSLKSWFCTGLGLEQKGIARFHKYAPKIPVSPSFVLTYMIFKYTDLPRNSGPRISKIARLHKQVLKHPVP